MWSCDLNVTMLYLLQKKHNHFFLKNFISVVERTFLHHDFGLFSLRSLTPCGDLIDMFKWIILLRGSFMDQQFEHKLICRIFKRLSTDCSTLLTQSRLYFSPYFHFNIWGPGTSCVFAVFSLNTILICIVTP